MGRRLQTAAAITFMKILLMIFNVIFWVTGVILLVIGIWMKISLHQFLELSATYKSYIPYVFIGIGALIICVGFLACCCTVKGHSPLLYLLSSFLFFVFVLELGAGVAGYVYRGTLKEGFRAGLNSSLYEYGNGGLKDKDIDLLQTSLMCCGVDRYDDWYGLPGMRERDSVPESCCRNKKKCHFDHVKNLDEIYDEGCYKKVIAFVNTNLGAIGGGAVGIAFFQLLGVVLAYCLAKHANKAKYEPVQ